MSEPCKIWAYAVRRTVWLTITDKACENLVGFSSSPAIFKVNQLLPVKDLKLLVRDYPVCM